MAEKSAIETVKAFTINQQLGTTILAMLKASRASGEIESSNANDFVDKQIAARIAQQIGNFGK